MNREEYLNQLKKHLRKLPKSDYENAMEYFTEYFEEVGEQQAMEELGTPEEAAADIVNNLLNQNPKNNRKSGKHVELKIFLGIFLLLFGAAAIVFLVNMGKGTDNGNIKVDTGQIKTGNTQKEGTENTQEGSRDKDGISTWQASDIRFDSVNGIKADLSGIDLKIAASDDKEFHMSYELHCMNRKNPLSYALENGILKLTATDFKEPSWSGWFWNAGNITKNYDNCITLHIPSDAVLKSCGLDMADGDLIIEGFHCNRMEIEAADGDMDIKDGFCQEALLKTEDGNIIFSNITVSGDLQIDTADGDINVSDLNVNGGAGFDTADGDISISSLTASGAVEIMSADGDIAISGFAESAGLFLQTEYGDISGSSINITGNMRINTADGDVALSNLGVSGKVDIASECGDVSIQIQKKSLSDLKMTVDTGDGELSVARSLGGKKRNGHYERDGSVSTYLNVDSEEGDISIQ